MPIIIHQNGYCHSPSNIGQSQNLYLNNLCHCNFVEQRTYFSTEFFDEIEKTHYKSTARSILCYDIEVLFKVQPR